MAKMSDKTKKIQNKMGQSLNQKVKSKMGQKPAAQTGKSKAMGAKYKPVGKK